MLKTSPILSDSGNASPTSFRYAPASSPQSSIRQPAAIRRRHSTRSTPSAMKSPSCSRPKHCATPDAESHQDPMDEDQTYPKPPFVQQSTESPAPPPPQPMANQTSTGASADNGPGQQSTTPITARNAQLLNAVSPNKRRGSPAPSIARTTASGSVAVDEAASQTTKRARPDSPPPKILPKRYELCPVEHMVELIAHMLAELIATNDAIRISNGGLTRFHSRTAPGISVRDYLHRLARHATLTPPLLLAMVYYIDRLCALYQEFTINTLTVHRFLITAATVASKGLSDSFWNNTTYARVGGVRVAELKLLELEFLYRVDWKIVPNPEVLVAYYKGLVERTPGYALESNGSDGEEDDEGDEDEDGVELDN